MKITTYQPNDMLKRIMVALIAGLLAAVALNFFLIPAKVFQAGLSGVSQLTSLLLQPVLHTGDITGWLICCLIFRSASWDGSNWGANLRSIVF